MKNFLHNFFQKLSTGKNLFLLFLMVCAFLVYLYNADNHVIIRFNELGALSKNMAAYYNGFKIGKITDIAPDKDFKHTLVKVNLISKDLNLPQNTTVKVENFPNGELFLEFIYPQSPSLKNISRGDILEGTAPYSLEQFMLGQNISGVSDLVSLHVIKALNAADLANQQMQSFFKTTSKLIEDNDKSIKLSINNTAAMTKSLAQMAENLNQASKKLNSSIDEKTLKDTTLNVKDATANIKETTESIAIATKDIDKTIQKLDNTMAEVNSTAQNLNAMTGGINETLSKRFAGMRIMFGTPIKQKNSTRNACK